MFVNWISQKVLFNLKIVVEYFIKYCWKTADRIFVVSIKISQIELGFGSSV